MARDVLVNISVLPCSQGESGKIEMTKRKQGPCAGTDVIPLTLPACPGNHSPPEVWVGSEDTVMLIFCGNHAIRTFQLDNFGVNQTHVEGTPIFRTPLHSGRIHQGQCVEASLLEGQP